MLKVSLQKSVIIFFNSIFGLIVINFIFISKLQQATTFLKLVDKLQIN